MEPKSGGKTEIYTVGKEGALVTVWSNSQEFTAPGAPKVGEKFMLLFTEPWMAHLFIRDEMGDPTMGIYRIDSQEVWDSLRGFVIQEQGAHRAVINRCISTNDHPTDRLFSVRNLRAESDSFEELLAAAANINCPTCYDIANMRDGDPIKMFSVSISRPEAAEADEGLVSNRTNGPGANRLPFFEKLEEFFELLLPLALVFTLFWHGEDARMGLYGASGFACLYFCRRFLGESLSEGAGNANKALSKLLGAFVAILVVSLVIGTLLWEVLGGDHCEGWAKSEKHCAIEKLVNERFNNNYSD